MPARVIPQHPQVIGQHHGGFRRQHACPVRLRIPDPSCARLIRSRVAGVFVHQNQRMGMTFDGAGGCLHRLFQIGHDHVDTRCQRLGLAGAQVVRQTVDIGVAKRGVQQRRLRQFADAHDGCVAEIAERFEVIRAVLQIVRHLRFAPVDQPVADRIQHRLMFAHRIQDRMRVRWSIKAELRQGRHHRQVWHLRLPRQQFARIMPHVNRAVLVRKQAKRHGAGPLRRVVAQTVLQALAAVNRSPRHGELTVYAVARKPHGATIGDAVGGCSRTKPGTLARQCCDVPVQRRQD